MVLHHKDSKKFCLYHKPLHMVPWLAASCNYPRHTKDIQQACSLLKNNKFLEMDAQNIYAMHTRENINI